MGDVLWCSASVWAEFAEAWLAIDPDLQVVLHDPGVRVPPNDVERITIGFFSGDLYPDHSASFMKVALGAPRLEWLHLYIAGTDHPVFGMFLDRGVQLTASNGAAAIPIAHTVLMQLLAMTRDAPRWFREQRATQWNVRQVADMEGRTVVVVGMGNIGCEVARLALSFGMRVIGLRRRPTGDEPCPTWPSERIDEALAVADDVVLCAPLTDDTRGLLDARRLQLLPPGAHVVNVGRGELIDEPALIDALRSGHLGFAALDVFSTEPLPADSPLWTMPNVIVTPHSAGATAAGHRRAAQRFTELLRGRFAG
jgi:D-2-hydroxyacid dehydrogenase (NADP+)